MGAFEGAVLEQTVAVARSHGLEPAALLAVVEVESAGKSLEVDGRTPCLLFERHIFYRELKKANKNISLTNAVALGLANNGWQPATQYKDQGTSQKRLDLFNRACKIDTECAIRSCSWGVGQTMGFLAESLGFANGGAMFSYMVSGGVPAQVECMVREIRRSKQIANLNGHNWAAFARSYNGPGYAKNHYDEKMAAAYLKWSRKTLPTMAEKPVEVNVPKPAPLPQPKPVTPQRVGIGAGIAAFFAGVWAAITSLPWDKIIFLSVLVVIIIATAVIVWKRRRDDNVVQLGTLAAVDGGA